MERFSMSGFLVAICIVIYCQSVFTSGTTVTSQSCSTDADCTTFANAMCNNKTNCACKDAFKDTGSTCEAKGLGDSCKADADCTAVTNALCHKTNHNCSCSGGFKKQADACAAKGLGDACIADTDCTTVTNALCHKTDQICSCSGGFKKQADNCVAKVLGATCAASNKTAVCTVPNTDCISGHCACLNSSYIEENDECKSGCSKSSDCGTNAECDKATSKCMCSTGYEDSNGKCSEQKSSADSVKKTINAIVVSFLCAALWYTI